MASCKYKFKNPRSCSTVFSIQLR